MPVSLPFGSAMAGRHFKVELPKPKYFSRISSDVDIQHWLIRVQEYMTPMGYEPAIWAVVASQFLNKVPLQLWEARKARLAAVNMGHGTCPMWNGTVLGHGAFLHSVFKIMRVNYLVNVIAPNWLSG